MKTHTSFFLTTLAVCIAPLHADPAAATSFYTGEKIYQSRPDPNRDTPFGCIGTTGLMARVYPDVTVKVEGMIPGSPAAGTPDAPMPWLSIQAKDGSWHWADGKIDGSDLIVSFKDVTEPVAVRYAYTQYPAG